MDVMQPEPGCQRHLFTKGNASSERVTPARDAGCHGQDPGASFIEPLGNAWSIADSVYFIYNFSSLYAAHFRAVNAGK